VTKWTFLSNHGRVLLWIARDPEIRLRDIAAAVSITERHAYGIVNDLVEAEYVIKEREGRRNHYEIRGYLPIPEDSQDPQDPQDPQTIGDVLDLLSGRPMAPIRGRRMAKAS